MAVAAVKEYLPALPVRITFNFSRHEHNLVEVIPTAAGCAATSPRRANFRSYGGRHRHVTRTTTAQGFAPCCASTQKPLRRPGRLPGLTRPAGTPRDPDRRMPNLHSNTHHCRSTPGASDLKKHYQGTVGASRWPNSRWSPSRPSCGAAPSLPIVRGFGAGAQARRRAQVCGGKRSRPGPSIGGVDRAAGGRRFGIHAALDDSLAAWPGPGAGSRPGPLFHGPGHPDRHPRHKWRLRRRVRRRVPVGHEPRTTLIQIWLIVSSRPGCCPWPGRFIR